MKRFTIILAVALFAIACNSDAPKHDVTFELVFEFGGQEFPTSLSYIGIFENMEFDLERSVGSILRNRMILNYDSIAPIHYDSRRLQISQQVIIPDIAEGNYFIAVYAFGLISGGERPRLGYRRIVVNRNTGVQRFVFDLSDEPNVFVEM